MKCKAKKRKKKKGKKKRKEQRKCDLTFSEPGWVTAGAQPRGSWAWTEPPGWPDVSEAVRAGPASVAGAAWGQDGEAGRQARREAAHALSRAGPLGGARVSQTQEAAVVRVCVTTRVTGA